MPLRPTFNPNLADDTGLVAIGGDLQPGTVLDAYRRGVFPWYDEKLPICWWSPDPRAIFEFDALQISRRLARTWRSGRFTTTFDRDFAGVIRGCAENREEGTWIVPEMIVAYTRLFELGHAHSVEVWRDGQLAGGLYGLAIGGFFAGESMFHVVSDASKIALIALMEHLRQRQFQLFDIQLITPHTRRLGATEIARNEYLRRLRSAVAAPTQFRDAES